MNNARGSRFVAFCCDLIPFDFTHITQDYLISTMTTLKGPNLRERNLMNMGKISAPVCFER